MSEFPLSFSQMRVYKRCPWRYNQEYNNGIRRRSTRLTMATGDFIHRLLHQMYAKDGWREEWGRIKSEYQDAQLFDEGVEEIAGLSERVYSVLDRYEQQVYLPHDADLTILHLEEELTASYRGIVFVVKPDLVVRDKQGLVWLLDHKTTMDFKEDTETELRYDDQMSLYLWALRERGLDVMGAAHNLIRTRLPRKPEVTKKGLLSRSAIVTDEITVRAAVEEYRAVGQLLTDAEVEGWLEDMSPLSEFFKRVTTFRSDDILDRLVEEYFGTYLDIAHARENERWTRTFIPRDCPRCPLRELCLADLQGADTESLMQTTYRVRGEEPREEATVDLL